MILILPTSLNRFQEFNFNPQTPIRKNSIKSAPGPNWLCSTIPSMRAPFGSLVSSRKHFRRGVERKHLCRRPFAAHFWRAWPFTG